MTAMDDSKLSHMYRRSMENTHHSTAIVPYEGQRYHVDIANSELQRELIINVTKTGLFALEWPFVGTEIIPGYVFAKEGENAYRDVVERLVKRVHNQWLNFVTYGAMGN